MESLSHFQQSPYPLKTVTSTLYDIAWSILKLKASKIYMQKRKHMHEFRRIDFSIRLVMKKKLKTKKMSWEYLLTLKFEFGINIQSD